MAKNKENSYTSDVDEMMNLLNYDSKRIEIKLKETKSKYPYLDSDADILHLIAKQDNKQFTYNKEGHVSGIKVADASLDIDLSEFLEF